MIDDLGRQSPEEVGVSSAADWASAGVTLVLGVAGFAVARNIRGDVRLRLAERRLQAYARLWSLMRVASPNADPLDEQRRWRLHAAFTDWYYANGDGMLLERVSRGVYFEAKDNLVRPTERVTPVLSRERLQRLDGDELQRQRGLLAQRQLSLLRTQLKVDLAMYGRPYGPRLGPEDRAFLTHCGVNVKRRPWKNAAQVDEPEQAEGLTSRG